MAAIKKYNGIANALFLCWPPVSSFFDKIIPAFKGNKIIYIGEDSGGCTATELFHKKLNKHFECVSDIQIRQWDGIHDHLTMYKRE